jgi:Lrp/AsnC family leucine-responsive transcriptional regulator
MSRRTGKKGAPVLLDTLVIVNAESMEQYHAFTREVFSSIHNVRNFKSMFAMNCSRFETRVPLPPAAA